MGAVGAAAPRPRARYRALYRPLRWPGIDAPPSSTLIGPSARSLASHGPLALMFLGEGRLRSRPEGSSGTHARRACSRHGCETRSPGRSSVKSDNAGRWHLKRRNRRRPRSGSLRSFWVGGSRESEFWALRAIIVMLIIIISAISAINNINLSSDRPADPGLCASSPLRRC